MIITFQKIIKEYQQYENIKIITTIKKTIKLNWRIKILKLKFWPKTITTMLKMWRIWTQFSTFPILPQKYKNSNWLAAPWIFEFSKFSILKDSLWFFNIFLFLYFYSFFVISLFLILKFQGGQKENYIAIFSFWKFFIWPFSELGMVGRRVKGQRLWWVERCILIRTEQVDRRAVESKILEIRHPWKYYTAQMMLMWLAFS